MSNSANLCNIPGTAAITACGQSIENPLIKVTAGQTINASIESLQVLDNMAELATILAEIRQEMPEAEVEKLLTVHKLDHKHY
jgi:hypothetical protein